MKVLAFSGSLRKKALSKMTLAVVVEGITDPEVEVEVIDLADYEMPGYNQDVEDKGMPEVVEKFKAKIKEADGLIISSPEYNHSIPGVLKNVFDWASRKTPELKDVFKGKPVGLITSSDGGFGGVRAAIAWLPIFKTLGLVVYPDQQPVPRAQDSFDENGKITDSKLKEKLTKFASDFVDFTKKHSR